MEIFKKLLIKQIHSAYTCIDKMRDIAEKMFPRGKYICYNKSGHVVLGEVIRVKRNFGLMYPDVIVRAKKSGKEYSVKILDIEDEE